MKEIFMKKTLCLLIGVLFFISMNCYIYSNPSKGEELSSFLVTSGLGFEYFNRTVSWDEDTYSSKLKSYIFLFNMTFKIQEGFFSNIIIGYSLSDFNSLVFRQLPISIELDVGNISGILFGGEIRKTLYYFSDFEIETMGQLVYYMGTQKEWDIPGLAVKGKATGKPKWMRAQVGPILKYTGIEDFTPYLFVNYNPLWGTFSMEEKIIELVKTEDKKISGKSRFGIAFGTLYQMSDSFQIKAELNILPYKDGIDSGLFLNATYTF